MKRCLLILALLMLGIGSALAQNWGNRFFRVEDDYNLISLNFIGIKDDFPEDMDGLVQLYMRDYEHDGGEAVNIEFYYKAIDLHKATLHDKKTFAKMFTVEINNGKAFIYNSDYELMCRLPEVFLD